MCSRNGCWKLVRRSSPWSRTTGRSTISNGPSMHGSNETADPRTWRRPQNDHRGRRCRRGEHPLSDLIAPARWIEGHRARQGGFDTLVSLQEEFALRMLGRHPMDRGPLSLNIALQWDLELTWKVGSGSFLLRQGYGAVCIFELTTSDSCQCGIPAWMVRQAFAHRRRKLGTTLRRRPTGLEDAGPRSVDWSDVIRRWRSEHVELRRSTSRGP